MSSQSLALIPRILSKRGSSTFGRALENVVAVFTGVVLLSLLAQVAIPLPWTPVPITGQTFGVALIAMLWGRARGFAVVLSYLIAGAIGLPVFAMAKSGLAFGPTFGYLLGMLVASIWMGFLADRGWTKTFLRAWLTAFSGSVIVFSFGLAVLSTFVPSESLLAFGLLPFLPGDFLKTLIASSVVYRASR
jgi:biotin transport system substrate-specific component